MAQVFTLLLLGASCFVGCFAGDGRMGIPALEGKTLRAFRATIRCPATGRFSGPCPGFVVSRAVSQKHGGAGNLEDFEWRGTSALAGQIKVVEFSQTTARTMR